MRATFNKYGHAFLLGLQSSLVYRWTFGVRSFFSLFHLAVVFILWGAAFVGSPRIGGFSFEQTLTYFLILFGLQFLVGAFNEDYQISEEIRSGMINQFLLKPINYYFYRASIFVAARVVSGAIVLVPMAIALPFLHHSLSFDVDPWRIAMTFPAAVMAAAIQFTIAYCFGLMTFWFMEIQGFVILSLAVESILGGQMFPLDLLPHRALQLAELLPFYYQMYFPAAILTGRITDHALVFRGLVMQGAWVVLLLAIAYFLWRRGLRRYTAFGG